MFSVTVERKSDQLKLQFARHGLAIGVLDNPNAYDAIDVSITLRDSQGERHILALPAVRVKRGQ